MEIKTKNGNKLVLGEKKKAEVYHKYRTYPIEVKAERDDIKKIFFNALTDRMQIIFNDGGMSTYRFELED